MAVESSNERQLKVPMKGSQSSDEWRPKFLTNRGRKFRRMAAESSDEWWLKVPMNGNQKFRGIFLKQILHDCIYTFIIQARKWTMIFLGKVVFMSNYERKN